MVFPEKMKVIEVDYSFQYFIFHSGDHYWLNVTNTLGTEDDTINLSDSKILSFSVYYQSLNNNSV